MLIACERCKRHFSIREEACPFCKHGGTLARVSAVALSAGVLLGGCDAGGKKADHSSAVDQKPYATVHGVVKDREGKTLQDALIIIGSPDRGTGRSYEKRVKTDASGRFAFDFLEPGGCSIYVQYNQYTGGMNLNGAENRDLVLKAGDDLSLDFALEVRDMGTAMPYGAPPARGRRV
jgi:hypothetical protein